MPLGAQEEDYSTIKEAVDKLVSSGVDNLTEYFRQNPTVLRNLISSVRVINVNEALLKIHRATKESFLDEEEDIDNWWNDEWVEFYSNEIQNLLKQYGFFGGERFDTRVDGSSFVSRTFSFLVAGYEESWGRVVTLHEDITNRKRIEAELHKAHDELEFQVLERTKELTERETLLTQGAAMANLGYAIWDHSEKIYTIVSEEYASIFGHTKDEFLAAFANLDRRKKLIYSGDQELFQAYYENENLGSMAPDIEYRAVRRDGEIRHIQQSCQYVFDQNNQVTQSLLSIQDITEVRRAEEELKQSHALYRQAESMGSMGHFFWDRKVGQILSCSDQYARIYGMTVPEVLEHFISTEAAVDLIHPDDKEFYKQVIVDSNQNFKEFDAEYRIITSSGDTRHVYERSELVLDNDGEPSQSFGTIQDITERKQVEEKLKRIAHYDLLTDLPNRVLLADRLSQAMMQCQRRNQSLAVAYLDLDGFKTVNDTHGHHVGDELLIAVSQRMKKALREGDTLARIGGDEFIAVMVDLEKISDSKPVLKRLLKAAADRVTVGDTVMQVSASIGVTFYPQDGVDADLLMRHADQAMYIAKQAGKNRYHLFDTAQDHEMKIQREGIADIRSALDRREFVLHYQPKVNMHTGEVIGVEALIRWQHPDRGLVPPLDFLPVIEGHGISLKLGEWVIDTALRQINQWQSMGMHLAISVNISAYQLQQDNFAIRLAALLAAQPDVAPYFLELEILETSELSDISQVFDTMNACHDLGVRFALDDFGTGYSSLTHLRRLPAHLIKIDQSFVRNMLEDTDDLAIIEGVIGLTKSFKRDVIAEGVETIAHGVALLELGCELAQGYGIARPMPADDIPEWISCWKADSSWLA
jgi:diguanylate cyclase (GGDEF)-like protein/PAS domain S-box-containing protein